MNKNFFIRQYHIFFTGLMFYTRIPCPKNISHDPEYLNRATRYFPIIGFVVGLISFAGYFIGSFINLEFGVILSLLFSLLTTGAFHEDGFADVCDGFGGGWSKEKILKIMKDSAIGAYGAIGLIILFLMKFVLLKEILDLFDDYPKSKNFKFFVITVCMSHMISRFFAISIIYSLDYTQDEDVSKSKPIAISKSYKDLIIAFFFGIVLFILHIYYKWYIIFLLIPLFVMRQYLIFYYKKWIGGYTGDCLGAAQQIGEVICYISIFILWNYF